MKITDMFVSAILKRGILYEARNVDVEFTVPQTVTETNIGPITKDIKIHFKADHMTLRIEKDKGEGA